MGSWGYDYGYKPYVSVAQRRAKAQREMAKLAKKGYIAAPVVIEGRKITTTFWGNSWCGNLQAYSDFANRLPRGRSYVCNGSVVDLQIAPGRIVARVMGSELYDVTIEIKPLARQHWTSVKTCCAGQIGSLVELLQGKLSKSVMEVVTRRNAGLFPTPNEMEMTCSCPDWADMCKHVAAVLYGIGARLDHQPDLLFRLRQVDHLELIAEAAAAPIASTTGKSGRTTIADDALSDVFGIDFDDALAAAPAAAAPAVPVAAIAAKTPPDKQLRRATKSASVVAKERKNRVKAKPRRRKVRQGAK